MLQRVWRRALAAALGALLSAGAAQASLESDTIDQAKALLRQGDAAGCVTVLEPLARISPDDVEAQAVLGIAKNELKDYAGAIEALERAKVLDPVNPEIRNQLGLAYAESGDYARALPELEYVFGRSPETPDVGYRLGRIHYQDTRYPPARDVLSAARSSNEEIKQRVLYLLGLTYERLGDRAQADKNLKLAVAAAPETELAKRVQAILDQTPATTTLADQGSSGEPVPTAPLERRKKLGVDAYVSGLYDANARLDPRADPDPVVTALRARPGRRGSGGFNVAVRPEYSCRTSARTPSTRASPASTSPTTSSRSTRSAATRPTRTPRCSPRASRTTAPSWARRTSCSATRSRRR
jgi:tetratricopeptide (TPR) repeat protein